MFEINDMDMPIDVARKIVTGTKPSLRKRSTFAFAKLVRPYPDIEATTDTDMNETISMEDMFTIEEIKEIADYLLVYYNSHNEGD